MNIYIYVYILIHLLFCRAMPTLLFRRRDGSTVERLQERREAAMGLGSKVAPKPRITLEHEAQNLN